MQTTSETGFAAVITGYIVAFFKLSFPDAHSSVLVAVAVSSGILANVLIAVAGGAPISAQNGAQWLVQGIVSAAVAAGLTRTDNRAEIGRIEETEVESNG